MAVANFQVERLRQLPQRTNDVWQGGLTRMPAWIQGEDDEVCRPWLTGWISLKTRRLYTGKPGPREEKDIEKALSALVDFACDVELAGYRPGRVEVKDPILAEELRRLLAEVEVEVRQREKLFIFDDIIAEMAKEICEEALLPNALDVKGVTVEIMRKFAEAACNLYKSRLCEQLTGEDLLEIESPFIGSKLRYFSLLGSGGITFGLAFYDSFQEFEAILVPDKDTSLFASTGHWVVFFEPITNVPFGDLDMWEDYDFAIAGDDAYPVAAYMQPNGKHRRPGPDIAAFLEGLMRVLTQTTEKEIDSGRFSRSVQTSKGQMEFTISLPELLETDGKAPNREANFRKGIVDRRSMERVTAEMHRALEEQDFDNVEDINRFLREEYSTGKVQVRGSETALEKAQDLVYQAFEVYGRKRIRLAKQALEICPDCADAYVILAEQTSDPQKAYELYSEGVAAGQRALGPEFFKEEAGHFWGILETRPYMRARFGVAEMLEILGKTEEAVEHYKELLRLNPNDNQGVRDVLLSCLLELNRDDEADKLLRRYKAESFASWSYPRALVTFRMKGDTSTARKQLQKALETNKYVTRYLIGLEELPAMLPLSYTVRSKEEAIFCASVLLDVWQQTPGAVEWLKKHYTKLK